MWTSKVIVLLYEIVQGIVSDYNPREMGKSELKDSKMLDFYCTSKQDFLNRLSKYKIR